MVSLLANKLAFLNIFLSKHRKGGLGHQRINATFCHTFFSREILSNLAVSLYTTRFKYNCQRYILCDALGFMVPLLKSRGGYDMVLDFQAVLHPLYSLLEECEKTGSLNENVYN